MSFDLSFFRNDRSLPTQRELADHFTKQGRFSITSTDSGSQYWYGNDETGVYCSFDAALGSDSCKPELYFNLNYVRPAFFAHEAMSLVETLCREFDLHVHNLQEDTHGPVVLKDLIQSWLDHNERAVTALSNQPDADVKLRYYPEERAMNFWRYSFARRRIENDLTEDHFVPVLVLIEFKSEIQQMFVLAREVSQLLPESDLVVVETRATPQQLGLIRYGEVCEALQSLSGECDSAIGPIKYIPHEHATQASKIIEQLPFIPFEAVDVTGVEPDSFHNVKTATT